jgi:peptide/nickel transport system ATP-binding protein
MLPDDGKICAEELPPWQEAGEGHRIFCHIPVETLQTFEPVITVGE